LPAALVVEVVVVYQPLYLLVVSEILQQLHLVKAVMVVQVLIVWEHVAQAVVVEPVVLVKQVLA
jgi:hypothetical protein